MGKRVVRTRRERDRDGEREWERERERGNLPARRESMSGGWS